MRRIEDMNELQVGKTYKYKNSNNLHPDVMYDLKVLKIYDRWVKTEIAPAERLPMQFGRPVPHNRGIHMWDISSGVAKIYDMN